MLLLARTYSTRKKIKEDAKMNNKLLISIILCIFTMISLVSAAGTMPVVSLGPAAGTSTPSALFYVNSSVNLTYNIYQINQTNNFTVYNNSYITNNITNNISYYQNVTTNITYYLNSTYNITYQTGVDTWYANYSAYSKFWYNHTSAIEALYGKWFYNQTAAAISLITPDNSSWNQTLAEDRYYLRSNPYGYLNYTYNDTYNTWLPNYTLYNKFWYNHTAIANNYTDSKLETIFYNVTSVLLVAGTNSTPWTNILAYNGDSYNVTESAGAPGLDIRFNYTNITEFNELIFRYKNTAGETHTLNLQVWDYNNNDWESYGVASAVPEYTIFGFSVYDYEEHIQNGTVQVRVYSASNGNTNHYHYFDWVTISKGPGATIGAESDPLSFHKNTNLDNSGYNITADWFFGKYNWTALADWLSFDGSVLRFNETKFNSSLASIGLMFGFNSTYNASYASGLSSWEANFTAYNGFWYNHTLAVESLYGKWFYNMTTGANAYTDAVVNANNASWLSTYNISYNGLINNASYLSTYNISYHATSIEWKANETAYGKFWYNHTLAIETLYGKWFYNMTTPANAYTDTIISTNSGNWNSTYNATYAKWAYNQTTAAADLYSAGWNSTYNATYDAKVSFVNTNIAYVNNSNTFSEANTFQKNVTIGGNSLVLTNANTYVTSNATCTVVGGATSSFYVC